jgi:hypothetical protein
MNSENMFAIVCNNDERNKARGFVWSQGRLRWGGDQVVLGRESV